MSSANARPGDLIGYCRVSTWDQNTDLQLDALDKAGCVRVFTDHASGTRTDRPELAAALDYLREGDSLVVWRLDRLGRSLRHLIETVSGLESMGVGFKSLQESIDTKTPGGRLVFHIFGALAEFERELIVDRTKAGLAAARDRGARPGRKRLLTPEKAAMLRDLHSSGKHSISEIAELLGLSRATVYRYLDRDPDDDGKH